MSTQPPSHSPQQPALPNPSQRRKPRLHPHYYIKRATGEFVPLVPVDELPVDFYGLPRSMAYVDNARMAFLGVKDPRMGVYRVKLPRLNVVTMPRRVVHEEEKAVEKNLPAAVPTQLKQLGDTEPSNPPAPTELEANPAAPSPASTTPTTGPSTPTAPGTTASPTTIQPQPLPTSASTTASAPAPSPATPATAPPAQQPELCHNWILGFCKWTPHCRRTHAMPATMEELRAIVLRRQPYRPGTHHVAAPAPAAQVQQLQQQHPAEVLRSYGLQREMAEYVHGFRGRGRVGRQQATSARARVVEAQLRKNPTEGEAIARRDKGMMERELQGQGQERGCAVDGEGAAAEQMKGVPTGQLVDVR